MDLFEEISLSVRSVQEIRSSDVITVSFQLPRFIVLLLPYKKKLPENLTF